MISAPTSLREAIFEVDTRSECSSRKPEDDPAWPGSNGGGTPLCERPRDVSLARGASQADDFHSFR